MILFVFGTRPEAIKLAPLIQRVRAERISYKVCVTSQHQELLAPFLEFFEIEPDIDLAVMRENQDLFYITTEVLSKLRDVLKDISPGLVAVQGDTTTTFAAAIAAQYERIPVAHVEAGLRSGSLRDPHPEEMNRKLTDHISELLFAPTERAKENLLQEGIPSQRILVTGNTIVDALELVLRDPRFAELEVPLRIPDEHGLVLVTAHRRENFGERLRGICRALCELVSTHQQMEIAFPVHLNPNIKQVVNEELRGVERVHLMSPLGYFEFLKLMERSDLILTDSGGLQEEAPSFKKHVFVLRETTERPEGLEAGIAKLIGTNPQVIIDEVTSFFTELPESSVKPFPSNPYGDGKACERIVSMLIDRISNKH